MGRITRRPPTPKIEHPHEVTVLRAEFDKGWIQETAARLAGTAGYRQRSAGWAVVRIAFDTSEKANALSQRLRRWRHEADLAEMRRRPCPIASRYAEASLRQHGVIWGLSTGYIRPIVQTYRRERMRCSTHEMPNSKATAVMIDLAPGIDFERGRLMVDAMLVYIEARHRDWFWNGLQGDRRISSFLRYA